MNWSQMLARVKSTLTCLVRHFHPRLYFGRVFGIGVAWSRPVGCFTETGEDGRCVNVKMYLVFVMCDFHLIYLPNRSEQRDLTSKEKA